MNIVDMAEVLVSNGDAFEARITLGEDLPEFRGHFPVRSILPGVVQLGWVRRLASAWLGRRLRMAGVPQMKFTLPLVPGDNTVVRLTAKEKDGGVLVSFTYDVERKGAVETASRGRVLLCE